MLSCNAGENDTAAILDNGHTWEWSKDPEIWPKQFQDALAARGL